MEKQILEIIDTIVKIGLGASISALAAYSTNNKNHKNIKENKLLDKKVEILEYATENIEYYLSAFKKSFSAVDGAIAKNIKNIDERWATYFKEYDDNFLETRKNLHTAASRLNLTGNKNIIKEIKSIEILTDQFRNKIVFEKKIYTNTEIKDLGNKFIQMEKKMHKELSSSFEKLYNQ